MALLSHYLSHFISVDCNEIALVPADIKTETKVTKNPHFSNIYPSSNILSFSSDSKSFPSSSSSNPTSNGQKNMEVQEDRNPNFEAYDEKTIWSTKTKVDIFSTSYQNNQNVVTVENRENDKLIAPGTKDSYTFWLKNTGGIPIDYTLEFEAIFSPENVKIPVKAKIKSHDGDWMLGEDEKWADVLNLNTVKDRATLDVNQSVKYTLDWQWPFERDNDSYDTYLGNRAVDEDLSLTIIIKTVAEANTGDSMADNVVDDTFSDSTSSINSTLDSTSKSTSDSTSLVPSKQPDADDSDSSTREDKEEDGIFSIPSMIADQFPKTGDILDMEFYIILIVASILGIILLLLKKRRAKEREK